MDTDHTGIKTTSAGCDPYFPAAFFTQKPENKFKPDLSDFTFALITFVLGYMFSRWVLFSWQGWGVSVFTTAYLLSVTAYLIKKGVFAADTATWFWLLVTWAVGVSYALWENAGFAGLRAFFLFCSATYYVIIASGRTIMGKTGNYLPVDGLNAVIILPFRNFINQYVSFSAAGKGEKRGKTLPVLLGALLALLLLMLLIPMLMRADSGGFSLILKFFVDAFGFIGPEFLLYAILTIPVSAYIYGLMSGAAHEKGTDLIKPDSARETVRAIRIIPPATINIVIGAICFVYVVFILSQIPYFFLAFTGRRPAGWLVYSEYARRGFFELSGIAAINLVVLTIGNLTSKKHRGESKTLKALNIALALITLILIATAFSKMALYISVYGLTMPRLLPCVFMLFLAVVFAALIALQKYSFSIVRFSLVTGAVIFFALCAINPDALVVRYNTNRYLSGTLSQYDVDILYRAGSAGVKPSMEVYEATQDEVLKQQIATYLRSISYAGGDGGHVQSLESYRTKELLHGIRLKLNLDDIFRKR